MAKWDITTANSPLEFDTAGYYEQPSTILVDSNHIMAVWSGKAETEDWGGFAQIFEVNTSTWAVTTANSAIAIGTERAYYPSCAAIDSNHFILFWSNFSANASHVQVLTVNTSTWAITTEGSPLQFISTKEAHNSCAQVDSNHFINFWGTGGGVGDDGYAQMFEVNTSTWAVTTAGATKNIDTTRVQYSECAVLDDTHVINFWAYGQSDGFTGNAQVFAINTSTWAITEPSSPLGYAYVGNWPVISPISENRFIGFYAGTDYDGYAQTFLVNTSTWAVTTTSTALEYDTTQGYDNGCCQIDSNHYVACWAGSGGDGYIQTFEVNTSTYAVTTAADWLEFDTTQASDTNLIAIDSSHVVCFWAGESNHGYAQALEIDLLDTYTKTATSKANIAQPTMRQVWLQMIALNSTATNYVHPQTAWKTDNGEHPYADYNTIEAQAQMVIPADGTLRKLYVNIQNDEYPGTSKSWTLTVRKDGGDTSLAATISDTDTSGNSGVTTLDVSAGDKISIGVTSTGSPTVQYASFSLEYEADIQKQSIISGGMRSGSSTIYGPFGLYCSYNYTIYDSDACLTKAPFDFTIKAVYVNLTTAPGAGATRGITIRRDITNLATVNVTDTDTENSSTGLDISISAGDNLGVMQNVSGSPASSRLRYSVLIESDENGYSWLCAGQGSSWQDAHVGFLGAPTDSTTEYKWYCGPTKFTLMNLYQKNDLLGSGASRIATVTKNGEDTELTCTCDELSRDANNTSTWLTFGYGDYANLYVDTTNDTEEGVISLAQYIMVGGEVQIAESKANILVEHTETATSLANIISRVTQTSTSKGRILGEFEISQPVLGTTTLPFPSKASIKQVQHANKFRTLMGKDKKDMMGKKYQYVMEWDVMSPTYYNAIEEEVRSGEPKEFTYEKWPQSSTGISVFGTLSERTYVYGTDDTAFWSSVSLTLIEENAR